ncbi:MAG TPA: methylated-DNA--[protein]-cysteine S-methyltransferase [Methylophilaceae bacterium]|jgi:methylated-DNA-[protein]-cysteine S-methyltransferase
MSQTYDAVISAPFGAVAIMTQDDYLISVQLLPSQVPAKLVNNPFSNLVLQQIEHYFAKPNVKFDVPYAVNGTHFQKRVWQAISEIPYGQTLTYSELAQQVGSGPRAVANVCGANQVPLVIPCHRVVAKSGLGGYMQGVEGGLAIKQWLLAHEAKA